MPTQTISRCGGSGSGFLTLLIAANPDALWPLDEVTGTTAHDQLSGGHDATASVKPPVWAADTSPLGTPAPSFVQDENFTTAWQPNMSGAWSCATWAKAMADGIQSVMNWGNPVGGHVGWALGRGAAGFTNEYIGELGDGAATQFIHQDAAATAGTWYWLAMTRTVGGLVSLYVNGVAQASTYSGTYFGGGPWPVALGYPVGTTATNFDVRLSYAAVWSARALSASEIAGIYSGV